MPRPKIGGHYTPGRQSFTLFVLAARHNCSLPNGTIDLHRLEKPSFFDCIISVERIFTLRQVDNAFRKTHNRYKRRSEKWDSEKWEKAANTRPAAKNTDREHNCSRNWQSYYKLMDAKPADKNTANPGGDLFAVKCRLTDAGPINRGSAG